MPAGRGRNSLIGPCRRRVLRGPLRLRSGQAFDFVNASLREPFTTLRMTEGTESCRGMFTCCSGNHSSEIRPAIELPHPSQRPGLSAPARFHGEAEFFMYTWAGPGDRRLSKAFENVPTTRCQEVTQ